MNASPVATRTSRMARFFQRMIMHNIGLKILSLAAAIALYSMVRGSEDATRSMFVDVVVLLPPPNAKKMLVSEVPDKVRLTVRGSRSLINSVRPEDLPPVQVDLRSANGSYFYFDSDDFEIPAGVQIVQIAPASIPLSWARRVEEQLPVLPQLQGSPGPGLSAEVVSVDPSTVKVNGPETEVEPMQGVQTDPVDVASLGPGRYERRVPLSQPPSHTQLGRVAAKVTLQVVAQEAEHTFEALSITVVGRTVAQVRPDRVDVTLWGPTADINKLKAWHIVPTVDASDLKPEAGTQAVPVHVRGVPDGLQVRVDPSTVLVTPRRERGNIR